MGELGTRLREARESRGISLEQAEKETRIRRAFLQALEEEHYDALPEDVYARGFVRNYARYLGLDSEELLTLYKRAAGASTASLPRVLNEPLSPRDGSGLGRGILIGAMVVVILVLAGWYAYNHYYLGVDPWPLTLLQTPTTMIVQPTAPQPLPTQTPEPVATTVVTAEQPTAPPTLAPTRMATATLAPTTVRLTATLVSTTMVNVVATETSSATAQPASVGGQASATPSPTATATAIAVASPTPAPTFEGGVQVQARVTAKTYLEVTIDGARTFTGLLDIGAEQVWNGRNSVRLRVGNAIGLELTVNGVKIDPLGQEGEVVEVTYTPTSPLQP